jgi:hypothetical protein
MARTRLGLAELHARTLEQELGEKLDGRGGEGVIDGTAEEYTDDVGLPGA